MLASTGVQLGTEILWPLAAIGFSMGEPDKMEPQLVAQPVVETEPQQDSDPKIESQEKMYPMIDAPQEERYPVVEGQENVPPLTDSEEKAYPLTESNAKVYPLTEANDKVYPPGADSQQKAYPLMEPNAALYPPTESNRASPPLAESQEKAYNELNWLVVAINSVCQLEGCKYVGENGTARRMHRHCLQLTPTGARCTYNTERTSNLPGHDRVHMKGEPEKEDMGNGIRSHDVVRPKKRKAERSLNESQQTPLTEVGASLEQVVDLQRKGIQYVEDCRLYRPKEIKDCLLGLPPEEKRETEARQLLVKLDTFLRRSGCSVGDLDLGFSEG